MMSLYNSQIISKTNLEIYQKRLTGMSLIKRMTDYEGEALGDWNIYRHMEQLEIDDDSDQACMQDFVLSNNQPSSSSGQSLGYIPGPTLFDDSDDDL